MLSLGIDLGSTTVKYVLLNVQRETLARAYVRHKSDVRGTLLAVVSELVEKTGASEPVRVLFSGSGALGLAEALDAPFVQEVVADALYLKERAPELDCAIELGGEDAKLLFLSNGVELRMNEACAGGTGAFIDQMAALLETDATGLDALARSASKSHPMASRCGVFAKTDVVALLNAGVPKSEVARSVFNAVAEQTIGGLACGRSVKGSVGFLGGPLGFLPGLVDAFVRRLGPVNDYRIFEDARYAVARGAALAGLDQETGEARTGRVWANLTEFVAALQTAHPHSEGSAPLEPLFKTDAERRAFDERHAAERAPRIPLHETHGPLYLGVDFGSTTVKAVVIDDAGRVVCDWYEPNEGNPLERLYDRAARLLDEIPEGAHFRSACTTGYGAELAKAALGAPFSEVETLAHQRGAAAFLPDVSYVIDIGGQDMKCLKVEKGLIAGVALNEACSSGCGSFLQTFARQLGLTLSDFVEAAMRSRHPCDLGTRCTVFMNSKVRQAQRDGAPIEDIAAGLCRSIVRNALYKVLRIHDPKELGEHVVVQGGTFLNDAVLRAFEEQIGRPVVRPDIAGLMGAYGCALIARERTAADAPDWVLEKGMLDPSAVVKRELRCKGCGNACRLEMHRFPSGAKFFSGNRCDFAAKSGGARSRSRTGFAAWKRERLFSGEVLDPATAPRGTIGIPRVLNMYEHYPYWRAFFTTLGFSVVLSKPSDHVLARSGLETIPSQSLCFPAKLAHGHATELARAGVSTVWFPCIPMEGAPEPDRPGRFACPVVAGYPEALRLNLEESFPNLKLLTPFLDLERPATVIHALKAAFPEIPDADLKRAVREGRASLDAWRTELHEKGEAIWHEHEASGEPLVVLAGHPYHMDPLVNHGIPELIESMGVEIVTEDAVAHLAPAAPEGLDVVNQWSFHSRLYRAASLVEKSPFAELVQLVSFGCGLDAITSEQVKRFLEPVGKLATMLKIDEGDTLGAARIRLRSLLAAVADRRRRTQGRVIPIPIVPESTRRRRPMKSGDTRLRRLYAPQMAPIHFPIVAGVLQTLGWQVEVLPDVRPEAIELGLAHVNNDACYPAIVVIGQLLDAVLSGDIDRKNSALLLAQTCGPCRATNYPTLLQWALHDTGIDDIPVVTLAAGKVSGFEVLGLGLKGLHRLMLALLYGDLIQRLSLFVRAYETKPGSTEALVKRWSERAADVAGRGDARTWARDARKMVADFMTIERTVGPKPRVGIVGEILLKYHPRANLDIVDEILREGAEPRLGDISSFVLYCLYDRVYRAAALEGPKLPALGAKLLIAHFERMRRAMAEALEGTPLEGVSTLKDDLATVCGWVSPGQEAGEGWLLTAEMLSFVAEGTPNVVCLQPFGCLPNHITGKGVMRAIRLRRPDANLCAIDFEAGTSRANVANRLKLFLAQARASFAGGSEQMSGEAKKELQEERMSVSAAEVSDASSETSVSASPETKAERDAQPDAYEDRDCAAS